MKSIKGFISGIPVLGALASRGYGLRKPSKLSLIPFRSSHNYWEARYSAGGNSGAGSYSDLALFKAKIINDFVKTKSISSIVEFGCGDGNQLSLASYPEYLGLDISATAILRSRKAHAGDDSKEFMLLNDYQGSKSDLSMSLDVIFHLVEDDVFFLHMNQLFNSSYRFVIIYSSNTHEIPRLKEGKHVRHRKFTDWIEENQTDWKLLQYIPNRYPYKDNDLTGSYSDFYIYHKTDIACTPINSIVL